VTPEQVHDLIVELNRERDVMRAELAALPELQASDGAAAVSVGIRDVVERIRSMMRHASHVVDGIDEVVKLYPKDVAPELDAQREKALSDRQAALEMWTDLAGLAEQLNESLMRLSQA